MSSVGRRHSDRPTCLERPGCSKASQTPCISVTPLSTKSAKMIERRFFMIIRDGYYTAMLQNAINNGLLSFRPCACLHSGSKASGKEVSAFTKRTRLPLSGVVRMPSFALLRAYSSASRPRQAAAIEKPSAMQRACCCMAPGAGLPSRCSGQAHMFCSEALAISCCFFFLLHPCKLFLPFCRILTSHRVFTVKRRRSPVLTHPVYEICRDPDIQSTITVNDVHPPGIQCASSPQVLACTRADK